MAENTKHYNILVADDEKSVTTSVSLVLKRAGHVVDAVPDGEDAYAKIIQDPVRYQILITDHLMVKVSGLELVARLQKSDFRGKILVLSGNLTAQIEEAYHKLGIQKIIHKPFELSELRDAVDALGTTLEAPVAG